MLSHGGRSFLTFPRIIGNMIKIGVKFERKKPFEYDYYFLKYHTFCCIKLLYFVRIIHIPELKNRDLSNF